RDSDAAAWCEARVDGVGATKREADVSPEIPRSDPVTRDDFQRNRGSTGFGKAATTHRMFRYFESARQRCLRIDGGVGIRPHEKIGLPAFHNPVSYRLAGRLSKHA